MSRKVVERVLVARDCGCEYMTGVVSLGPAVACDTHRYIQCGKCNGRAEVTPFGMWCSHCTFGGEIIPWVEPTECEACGEVVNDLADACPALSDTRDVYAHVRRLSDAETVAL